MELAFKTDWFNFILNLLELHSRWQYLSPKGSWSSLLRAVLVQTLGFLLCSIQGPSLKPPVLTVVSGTWEFQSEIISCHLSEVLCPFKASDLGLDANHSCSNSSLLTDVAQADFSWQFSVPIQLFLRRLLKPFKKSCLRVWSSTSDF